MILLFCVCLWLQVRLVINEKGLVCEERDVSLPLQEHKEPWFMRLNLGEEVPVFLHGDTIISDYNQIIDYLEKNFVGGMEWWLPVCLFTLNDRTDCLHQNHHTSPPLTCGSMNTYKMVWCESFRFKDICLLLLQYNGTWEPLGCGASGFKKWIWIAQ